VERVGKWRGGGGEGEREGEVERRGREERALESSETKYICNKIWRMNNLRSLR